MIGEVAELHRIARDSRGLVDPWILNRVLESTTAANANKYATQMYGVLHPLPSELPAGPARNRVAGLVRNSGRYLHTP